MDWERVEEVGRTLTVYVTMPILIVAAFAIGGLIPGLIMIVVAVWVGGRHERRKQQRNAQAEGG